MLSSAWLGARTPSRGRGVPALALAAASCSDGRLLLRGQAVHLRLGEGLADARPAEVDADDEGQERGIVSASTLEPKRRAKKPQMSVKRLMKMPNCQPAARMFQNRGDPEPDGRHDERPESGAPVRILELHET